MSPLRTPKNRRTGSTWQRLRDSLFSVERRGAKERKSRRLRVDPLEERTLLSVSPVNPTDMLVNQGTAAIQTTLAGQSVATDHSGDFVAVWTRTEAMLNPDGTPVLDPASGAPMSGTNVYARYFTDQVQRITLPAGVLNGSGNGKYGEFSLVLGGSEGSAIEEVDQISFTQATPCWAACRWRDRSAGRFRCGSTQTATAFKIAGEVTAPINFNEFSYDPANPTGGNALAMQTALRALGGPLANVTVTGTDADDYQISYPINFDNPADPSYYLNTQPALAAVDAAWDSGFLPAAEVTEVSHPWNIGLKGTVANIPVSPTNPALTAAAIQQAFLSTTQYNVLMAPVLGGDIAPADFGPDTMTWSVQVVVTPAPTAADPQGLLTFDITFVGNLGYEDLPQLVIPAGKVIDATKTPVNSTDLTAVIKKESSPEFRVNPEVPVNPFQLQPDVCAAPAVAMDADGDFVISWTAEVSSLANAGSDTDIFARQFEPVGIVSPNDPGIWQVDMNNDGVPDTSIQGVRPMQTPDPYNALLPQDLQVPGDLYTFRVNTNTANAQDQSTVAMDDAGDFVIAWASTGQDESFFNAVHAQQFDHNGMPLNNEVVVSPEDTNRNYDPYVAMSQDGHWLVVWTNDTNASGHAVYAQLFDSTGTTLLSMDTPATEVEHIGIGEPTPTATFDENNDFAISWTLVADTDNIRTRTSALPLRPPRASTSASTTSAGPYSARRRARQQRPRPNQTGGTDDRLESGRLQRHLALGPI